MSVDSWGFEINFQFSAWSEPFDVEGFAEAVFNLLCSSPEALEAFNYSCDGWDAARVCLELLAEGDDPTDRDR